MGPFVFLDIETTGFSPEKDLVIEVAAIRWDSKNGVTGRYDKLVNPGCPVPAEITLLTGITGQDLLNAPRFEKIKKDLEDFVGSCPIVGHNIAFDISFLRSHNMAVTNPSIDTLHLARILLKKESSYALEVLTKKYGLTPRDAHRAMADTETTLDFFTFLLGKISEIPREVLVQFHHLLKKSSWVGASVFAELVRPKPLSLKNTSETEPLPASTPPQKPPQLWSQITTKDFLSGQKILLESSGGVPFEALKAQPLVIAYSSVRKRNALEEEARAAGLTVWSLKEPQFFLSPKKLDEKIAAEKIESEETPFLLKMLLWQAETETGDREEITLEREEYGLFETLCDQNAEDIFYRKALEQVRDKDTIFIHHYALAHGLAKEFSGHRALIIVEADRLEDSITNAHRKRYTFSRLRPFFGEKTTFLFGLLGIFYEQFVEPDYGGYRGNVVLTDPMRNSKEWKQFWGTLENLPDMPKKQELIDVCGGLPGEISWVSSFADEITFHSAPVFLGEIFRQAAARFSQITMQSKALSVNDSFGLIREIFELDSSWKELREEDTGVVQNLTVKFPEKLPEPSTEGYFKNCIKLFTTLIEEKRGRVLFLLNSKKNVEATYRALLPAFPNGNTKILAVGMSGGVGKSLALFKQHAENAVLLTTQQVLPYLSEIEALINVIVFQKLPFDPPDDPILKARGAAFENGFQQYSLPRAVLKFRSILHELASYGSKTCWLLDRRLQTRDYGKLFF